MPVTRERSCDGKTRYLQRKDAARAARTIRRNGRTQGNPRGGERRNPDLHMRPYACRFCGMWHLGHFTPTADYPEAAALDRPWYEVEGCPDCGRRQFARDADTVNCAGCGLPVDEC